MRPCVQRDACVVRLSVVNQVKEVIILKPLPYWIPLSISSSSSVVVVVVVGSGNIAVDPLSLPDRSVALVIASKIVVEVVVYKCKYVICGYVCIDVACVIIII